MNCLVRRVVLTIALVLSFSAAEGFPQTAGIQEGMASWYGDPFHGRTTASGEVFDKTRFTCAHLTFDFGTRLLVTNLVNDRQVIVRVTDRGPFAKGRIIDLSEAAGESLGMLSTGVARVRIEVVSPSSEPGPATKSPSPGIPDPVPVPAKPDSPLPSHFPDAVSIPSPVTVSIQVASFASRDYAERAAAKLMASGFNPEIETVPDPRSPLSRQLHRIIIRGIGERELESTRTRLSGLGFREVVIRKETRLPS